MKIRQGGASLLIPVLVLITVAAFAVIVAASQSGSDIQGTDAQADSIEALLLAETGLERAIRRFAAGSACSAAGLSESITDLSTIGLGTSGRTITITAGPSSNTDFNAVALPATRCRIQVTGAVTSGNVSRTIQAIVDRSDNFVGEPLIAGFDNPAGVGAPASWTGGAYDYTGGLPTPSTNPPSCTRAGYLVHAQDGGGVASSVGTASLGFTIARPTTTTILATFDYRIIEIGNGSAACSTNSGAGACSTTMDPTSPRGLDGGEGQFCLTLRDTAGTMWNSTRYEVREATTITTTVTTPNCTPTTQRTPTPGAYTPCSTWYNNSGGTATGRGTVRWTFAAGAPISFDQVGFKLYARAGTIASEMWIDNIVLTLSTGAIAGIAAWRDCSVTACPAV